MERSKKRWSWITKNRSIFESWYWVGFGLGIGFFGAEILVSGIEMIVRDVVLALVN